MILLLQISLLVLCANGAPVLAQHLFRGTVLSGAIDNGLILRDQRPLFGVTKTWGGIVASVVLTSLLAILIGLPIVLGFLIAIFAMSGDLISSFIKRRLGFYASSQVIGLDQIPESLLPWIFITQYYQLSVYYLVSGVVIFFILELSLSRLLYKIGIRKRPY